MAAGSCGSCPGGVGIWFPLPGFWVPFAAAVLPSPSALAFTSAMIEIVRVHCWPVGFTCLELHR